MFYRFQWLETISLYLDDRAFSWFGPGKCARRTALALWSTHTTSSHTQKTIFVHRICVRCAILTSRKSFCSDPGFNWVLSIILIATSLPVGICFANFTLAKLPLPIVFNSLYLPMCSSPGRHRSDTPGRYCVFGEPCLNESYIMRNGKLEKTKIYGSHISHHITAEYIANISKQNVALNEFKLEYTLGIAVSRIVLKSYHVYVYECERIDLDGNEYMIFDISFHYMLSNIYKYYCTVC